MLLAAFSAVIQMKYQNAAISEEKGPLMEIQRVLDSLSKQTAYFDFERGPTQEIRSYKNNFVLKYGMLPGSLPLMIDIRGLTYDWRSLGAVGMLGKVEFHALDCLNLIVKTLIPSLDVYALDWSLTTRQINKLMHILNGNVQKWATKGKGVPKQPGGVDDSGGTSVEKILPVDRKKPHLNHVIIFMASCMGKTTIRRSLKDNSRVIDWDEIPAIQEHYHTLATYEPDWFKTHARCVEVEEINVDYAMEYLRQAKKLMILLTPHLTNWPEEFTVIPLVPFSGKDHTHFEAGDFQFKAKDFSPIYQTRLIARKRKLDAKWWKSLSKQLEKLDLASYPCYERSDGKQEMIDQVCEDDAELGAVLCGLLIGLENSVVLEVPKPETDVTRVDSPLSSVVPPTTVEEPPEPVAIEEPCNSKEPPIPSSPSPDPVVVIPPQDKELEPEVKLPAQPSSSSVQPSEEQEPEAKPCLTEAMLLKINQSIKKNSDIFFGQTAIPQLKRTPSQIAELHELDGLFPPEPDAITGIAEHIERAPTLQRTPSQLMELQDLDEFQPEDGDDDQQALLQEPEQEPEPMNQGSGYGRLDESETSSEQSEPLEPETPTVQTIRREFQWPSIKRNTQYEVLDDIEQPAGDFNERAKKVWQVTVETAEDFVSLFDDIPVAYRQAKKVYQLAKFDYLVETFERAHHLGVYDIEIQQKRAAMEIAFQFMGRAAFVGQGGVKVLTSNIEIVGSNVYYSFENSPTLEVRNEMRLKNRILNFFGQELNVFLNQTPVLVIVDLDYQMDPKEFFSRWHRLKPKCLRQRTGVIFLCDQYEELVKLTTAQETANETLIQGVAAAVGGSILNRKDLKPKPLYPRGTGLVGYQAEKNLLCRYLDWTGQKVYQNPNSLLRSFIKSKGAIFQPEGVLKIVPFSCETQRVVLKISPSNWDDAERKAIPEVEINIYVPSVKMAQRARVYIMPSFEKRRANVTQASNIPDQTIPRGCCLEKGLALPETLVWSLVDRFSVLDPKDPTVRREIYSYILSTVSRCTNGATDVGAWRNIQPEELQCLENGVRKAGDRETMVQVLCEKVIKILLLKERALGDMKF